MSRIVIFANERVGKICVETLINLGKNIVGVLTSDDSLKPQIADFVSFDDLRDKVMVEKIYQSNHGETVKLVKKFAPDLILAFSWSQVIPKGVLEIPSLGCVVLHYYLLPARRGGAPLFWAINDGLTETGISLYYMDEGIDTGDVIDQRAFSIGTYDTIKDLLDRIIRLAPLLLSKNIDLIEQRTAPRVMQNELYSSTTERRYPRDSWIDWDKSLPELYNFIRALSPPYPSAFALLDSRELVIEYASLKGSKLVITGYIK